MFFVVHLANPLDCERKEIKLKDYASCWTKRSLGWKLKRRLQNNNQTHFWTDKSISRMSVNLSLSSCGTLSSTKEEWIYRYKHDIYEIIETYVWETLDAVVTDSRVSIEGILTYGLFRHHAGDTYFQGSLPSTTSFGCVSPGIAIIV